MARRAPPRFLPAARRAFFLRPAGAVGRMLGAQGHRGAGPQPPPSEEGPWSGKVHGGPEVTSLWRQEHDWRATACDVRDSDCCLRLARPAGRWGRKGLGGASGGARKATADAEVGGPGAQRFAEWLSRGPRMESMGASPSLDGHSGPWAARAALHTPPRSPSLLCLN